MTDMDTIERRAKEYANARARLALLAGKLEGELQIVRGRHMPVLRAAIEKTVWRKENLSLAIEDNRALFAKPKTRLFHGIRLGLVKGKGKLVFALKPEEVIARIRKHLGGQADALIKVSETPARNALARLSAAELKKIGVSVSGTGDEVSIKAADSEIDKLIDALLARDGEGGETDTETKPETGGKRS